MIIACGDTVCKHPNVMYYTINLQTKKHMVYVSNYLFFLSLRSVVLPEQLSRVKVNLRLPFEELPEHSFSDERTSSAPVSVGATYLRTRVFKATVSASSFDVGALSSPVR